MRPCLECVAGCVVASWPIELQRARRGARRGAHLQVVLALSGGTPAGRRCCACIEVSSRILALFTVSANLGEHSDVTMPIRPEPCQP